MTRIIRIKQKLDVLKPQYLEIIDQSSSHHDHFTDKDSEQTHLALYITADILKDKNKLAGHRMINQLLLEEFNTGLHALSINIIAQDTRLVE